MCLSFSRGRKIGVFTENPFRLAPAFHLRSLFCDAKHAFRPPTSSYLHINTAKMNVVEAPSKQFMVLPGMSRHHKRRPTSSSAGLRIPLLSRVNPTARGHVVAMIGEFFGTFMFLFFAFAATNVANASAAAQVRAQALQQGSDASAQTIAQAPQASTLLYISLAFGFSLAVNVWIFFRISGGKSCPSSQTTSFSSY